MGVFKIFKPGYFFVGAGSITLCYWVVRTLRWAVILKDMNIEVPFIDLYLCSSVIVSLSIFTPVQSGEVFKVELLKRYGLIERLPGYSSFIVERIADMAVVSLLACCSLLFYRDILIRSQLLFVMIFFIIVLVFGATILLAKYPLKGKSSLFIKSIKKSLVNTKVFSKVMFLTLVGWCLTAFAWKLCLYSLSIDIGIQESIAMASIMTLINILSFIPGAVGIAEAGTAVLLIQFGQEAPTAQAGALILRLYALFVAILGAPHLVAWLLFRKSRSRLLHSVSD